MIIKIGPVSQVNGLFITIDRLNSKTFGRESSSFTLYSLVVYIEKFHVFAHMS